MEIQWVISDEARPSEEWLKTRRQWFETGHDADMAFVVGGQIIPAQRSRIVTMSNVFENFLSHPSLGDCDFWVFEVEGIEPEVFRKVICFCYIGFVENMSTLGEAYDLLKVARIFQMPFLEKLCELFIQIN